MERNPDDAAEHVTHRLVEQARDLLFEAISLHENVCDDPACTETHNMIAFLAHAVGMKTSRDINEMEKLLDRYNRACPGCTERN